MGNSWIDPTYQPSRGFNKFWHKWVVQHNRQVLCCKAFLSMGVWGHTPHPGKFLNPRLLQMHFPAFWGLLLFCFVVVRSQPIWTNLTFLWSKKGGLQARMSFLSPFLLFPITQDLFLPNFLARIRSRKSYLTFVCGYKQVFGSLQAGRSNHYPSYYWEPCTIDHNQKSNHDNSYVHRPKTDFEITIFNVTRLTVH